MTDSPDKDNQREAASASDSPIIDAEAEPLPQPSRPSSGALARFGRWALFLVLAVAACIGIAAVYHFSTQPPGNNASPGSAKPAIVATQPMATPIPAPAGNDADLARQVQELDRRLAALAASLERLQQLPAANTGADPGQTEKLGHLESQAAENRKASNEALRLAEAALTGQAQFDQKLADLSRARAADLRQPVAVLLAWQALRDKAARGNGFAVEANALAGLLGAAASGGTIGTAFAAVQAQAANGAPTPLALAAGFGAVAEAQQREAASLPPADGAVAPPWWQRALDKLAGLVTIRRVGGNGAEIDPADRLARAETLLLRGDLGGAQAALEGINAGPSLLAWREGAEARLKLDAALERLQQALRDHFAAAP